MGTQRSASGYDEHSFTRHRNLHQLALPSIASRLGPIRRASNFGGKHMGKYWKLILALLAVFSLVAAACGDDDDATTTGSDDSGEAADDGEAEAADDGEAEPADDDGEMAEDDQAMAEDEAMVEGDVTVGLVYDIGGRGDLSFNDSAAAGLEKAEADLGIPSTEASPNDDGSNRGELLQLAADGNGIVIGVGFLFEGDAAAVAAENPDTNFAVVDSAMLDFSQDPAVPYGDNVAGLVFAAEQGSFLVGAAAALKTTSNQLGYIGGVCCFGLLEVFEAGFRAGALAINPDIEIVAEYITDAPDFDGFNQPDRAKVIATTMYEDGADIIYHVAGGAGNGMFQAAKEFSEDTGSKVWGIGVDADQYNTIGAVDPSLQEYVLTSMLKRVDVAVFEVLKAQQDGNFVAGPQVYDLSVDGVGYSTSGGFIDDIVDQLEAFKADIAAGTLVVPTDPTLVGG
jgi:basic membrane protein A